jgi:hypothetical protein
LLWKYENCRALEAFFGYRRFLHSRFTVPFGVWKFSKIQLNLKNLQPILLAKGREKNVRERLAEKGNLKCNNVCAKFGFSFHVQKLRAERRNEGSFPGHKMRIFSAQHV